MSQLIFTFNKDKETIVVVICKPSLPQKRKKDTIVCGQGVIIKNCNSSPPILGSPQDSKYGRYKPYTSGHHTQLGINITDHVTPVNVLPSITYILNDVLHSTLNPHAHHHDH